MIMKVDNIFLMLYSMSISDIKKVQPMRFQGIGKAGLWCVLIVCALFRIIKDDGAAFYLFF